MEIIFYSDLHLEFGADFKLPRPTSPQILILAGDIISFGDYAPLERLLSNWTMPVLYVAGNHEFYECDEMEVESARFKCWLHKYLPQVHFLQDEMTTVSGVNFFGGTMWTDFANSDQAAMSLAIQRMNDYRLIKSTRVSTLTPEDTIKLHHDFRFKLGNWLTQPMKGPRVVVTHHAPVHNLKSKYKPSLLTSAFVAQDIKEIIKKHEIDLWIYGHTHECDDQKVGTTRIVSNQLGYPSDDISEDSDFDPLGRKIKL